MDVDRRILVLETTLSRQLAWIAAADAKTGFIFALATAMLGLLAAASPPYGKWTAWGVILSVAASLLLLLCIAALVAGVFPRTKGPKLSLIFFGGIIAHNLDDFREHMQTLSPEIYEEDLVEQCHINATIAATKYYWVKIATVLLVTSLPAWISAAYVLFRDK